MNSIALASLTTFGSGLHRPECVLATSRGMLYTADWRGGVYAINPHGQQHLYQAEDIDFEIRSNGIALMPNGDFLIAHLGETRGGLFQLTRKGHCTPLVNRVKWVSTGTLELSPPRSSGSNLVNHQHSPNAPLTGLSFRRF